MCSRRTRIRLVRLLVVCGLALVTPVHAASPRAPADDGCLQEPACSAHYQKAISLYEAGSYDAALPEFQAAYASRQMPWLLINIGRTFHRLGRLDEAVTLYNRYEQAVPNGDPETLKKVREYKAQAQVLLAAKNTPPPPVPTTGSSPSPAVTADPLTTGVATPPTPLYKKWWFWTAIGGGVAVIVISGIAIGLGTQSSEPSPTPPTPLPPLYPAGTIVYHPMF